MTAVYVKSNNTDLLNADDCTVLFIGTVWSIQLWERGRRNLLIS